jgi:hypothetical protein
MINGSKKRRKKKRLASFLKKSSLSRSCSFHEKVGFGGPLYLFQSGVVEMLIHGSAFPSGPSRRTPPPREAFLRRRPAVALLNAARREGITWRIAAAMLGMERQPPAGRRKKGLRFGTLRPCLPMWALSLLFRRFGPCPSPGFLYSACFRSTAPFCSMEK